MDDFTHTTRTSGALHPRPLSLKALLRLVLYRFYFPWVPSPCGSRYEEKQTVSLQFDPGFSEVNKKAVSFGGLSLFLGLSRMRAPNRQSFSLCLSRLCGFGHRAVPLHECERVCTRPCPTHTHTHTHTHVLIDDVCTFGVSLESLRESERERARERMNASSRTHLTHLTPFNK